MILNSNTPHQGSSLRSFGDIYQDVQPFIDQVYQGMASSFVTSTGNKVRVLFDHKNFFQSDLTITRHLEFLKINKTEWGGLIPYVGLRVNFNVDEQIENKDITKKKTSSEPKKTLNHVLEDAIKNDELITYRVSFLTPFGDKMNHRIQQQLPSLKKSEHYNVEAYSVEHFIKNNNNTFEIHTVLAYSLCYLLYREKNLFQTHHGEITARQNKQLEALMKATSGHSQHVDFISRYIEGYIQSRLMDMSIQHQQFLEPQHYLNEIQKEAGNTSLVASVIDQQKNIYPKASEFFMVLPTIDAIWSNQSSDYIKYEFENQDKDQQIKQYIFKDQTHHPGMTDYREMFDQDYTIMDPMDVAVAFCQHIDASFEQFHEICAEMNEKMQRLANGFTHNTVSTEEHLVKNNSDEQHVLNTGNAIDIKNGDTDRSQAMTLDKLFSLPPEDLGNMVSALQNQQKVTSPTAKHSNLEHPLSSLADMDIDQVIGFLQSISEGKNLSDAGTDKNKTHTEDHITLSTQPSDLSVFGDLDPQKISDYVQAFRKEENTEKSPHSRSTPKSI